MAEPIFFSTPAEFRAWLHTHHATRTEVLVGFHKKDTGRPTMTWPDSVDEALCYGWIDGVRRSQGEGSYTIRFTPRKPVSIWSNVNIAKIAALTAAGRMMPAGIAAWERRKPDKMGIYSFEKELQVFEPAMDRAFRKNRKAWAYFEAQAPYYRKQATGFVVGAKRPETRERRFALLVECSEKGERLPHTVNKPKATAKD